MNGRFFNHKTAQGAKTLGGLVLMAALAFAACQNPTEEEKEYTVTVSSSITGGRIIPVPAKASEGTEITLVLIPNVYYSLAVSPEVTLADGSVVDLTEKEETEPYTFAMPAANVTVSASFRVNDAHNDIPLSSAADLAKIGVDPAYPMNGVYKLEANFTVDNWTPVGEFPGKPFTGILHGNNHTVTINSFSAEGLAKQAVGLFGYTAFAEMDNLTVDAELDAITVGDETDTTGIIAFGLVIGNSLNVNLKNINVSGEISKIESTNALAAGGMVGLLTSGKIETSQVTIKKMVGDNSVHTYIGGIAGYTYAYTTAGASPYTDGIIISGCSFVGSIEGSAVNQSYAGGIVGFCYIGNTTIRGCQVTGNITAGKTENNTYAAAAGGIVGENSMTISIDDCSVGEESIVMSSGSSGVNYAGGITGHGGAITRCTSAADVTASFEGTTSNGQFGVYAGGITGSNSSSVQYCSSSGLVQAHNTGTMTSRARNRTSAGGISGQNTGSISQCYATGSVESLFSGDTTSLDAASMDYVVAGGIAGLTGDTSGASQGIISDCYYAGDEISAEGNYAHAGGITGLVNGKTDETGVFKSYARGFISAKGYGQFTQTTTYMGVYVYKRNAAGGIAGSAPAGTTNTTIPAIENCVALTGALTVAGPKATESGRPEAFYINSGRIAGTNIGAASGSGYTSPGTSSGTLTNNAANSAMTIARIITDGTNSDPEVVEDDTETPENTLNGKGVSIPPSQTVYTEMDWDFPAVWKMVGDYPVLAWQN